MFLGIDVSKNTLDVVLLKQSTQPKPLSKPPHKVFPNSIRGHEQLLAWLTSHRTGSVHACSVHACSVHACLEATGTWAEGVALVLHEAGHTVSLVNPAQVRAFGQSQLKRTKTDQAEHN